VPTVATLLKGLRESEGSIEIGDRTLPISSVGPFLMEGILLERDLYVLSGSHLLPLTSTQGQCYAIYTKIQPRIKALFVA
jgi:hypothetical protein